MLNCSACVLQIAVEYEICIGLCLAVLAEKKCSSIEIEISSAVILVCVPAKSYEYLCESGVCFCQINFLTLL